MQILKKVSVATVCAKPKSFFKSLEVDTPLMRLIGLARKYDIGQSTYGDYLKFMGEFHATDLSTGEQSVGAVCFLPAPVDAMLKEQIDQMSDGGKKPVEFAFDIHVIPDPKTEVGFQYRVKALTETKTSDPLAALAAKFTNVPTLAAPEVAKLETAAEQVSPGYRDVLENSSDAGAVEPETVTDPKQDSHGKQKKK